MFENPGNDCPGLIQLQCISSADCVRGTIARNYCVVPQSSVHPQDPECLQKIASSYLSECLNLTLALFAYTSLGIIREYEIIKCT